MKKALGIFLLMVLLSGVGAIFFAPPFEKKPPQVQLPHKGSYIKAKSLIEVALADRPTGLKEVIITLHQEGKTWTLHSRVFPMGTYFIRIPLILEPQKLGLKEGPATLEVIAKDRSLWNLGRGNLQRARIQVTVDYTPPSVELLDNTRYVYSNGAGAAIFQTSPDTVKAGVQVGNLFFKAYPKKEGNKLLWAVLFGLPYYAHSQKAQLVAQDKAGNTRMIPLSIHLLPRKVVKETLTISDSFIQNKIYPLLPPQDSQTSPVEAFKKVNEELRHENEATISRLAVHSSDSPLWQGSFMQMKNSKVTATFGDQRTYIYNGKVISHSTHMGYDLASVAHAPVPAANKGQVIYTGFIGIYGNVVILDHGLSLSSLYAHLSRYLVKKGDLVKKGQIIGYTGSTGLAGGDHLHFGVLLSGHPVNPVEWWDRKWLRERIMAVLKPYLQGEKGVQAHSD